MAKAARYRWQNEKRAMARQAREGGPAEYLDGRSRRKRRASKKRKGPWRQGRTPAPPRLEPTERQLAYIRSLAAQLGVDPPVVTTRRAASGRIDVMKARLEARARD